MPMGNRMYLESRQVGEQLEYRGFDDYDDSGWVWIPPESACQSVFEHVAIALEASDSIHDLLWAAHENETSVELNDEEFDVSAFFSFLGSRAMAASLEGTLEAPSSPKPKSRL